MLHAEEYIWNDFCLTVCAYPITYLMQYPSRATRILLQMSKRRILGKVQIVCLRRRLPTPCQNNVQPTHASYLTTEVTEEFEKRQTTCHSPWMANLCNPFLAPSCKKESILIFLLAVSSLCSQRGSDRWQSSCAWSNHLLSSPAHCLRKICFYGSPDFAGYWKSCGESVGQWCTTVCQNEAAHRNRRRHWDLPDATLFWLSSKPASKETNARTFAVCGWRPCLSWKLATASCSNLPLLFFVRL